MNIRPGSKTRLREKLRRIASKLLARRCVRLNHGFPVVSFGFDDFPKSALHNGGRILRQLGVAATYYTAFGLMDGDSPVGPIFSLSDLHELLASGHELGCHTFSHCNSWEQTASDFEASIVKNARTLSNLVPKASFETMAYPFGSCNPRAKWIAGKYFSSCRGGIHGFNVGWTDLNNLRSVALERFTNDPTPLREVVDRNRHASGWLILRTHDTVERPGPFGCNLEFFENIARYIVESGAIILPVGQAWRTIQKHLI